MAPKLLKDLGGKRRNRPQKRPVSVRTSDWKGGDLSDSHSYSFSEGDLIAVNSHHYNRPDSIWLPVGNDISDHFWRYLLANGSTLI